MISCGTNEVLLAKTDLNRVVIHKDLGAIKIADDQTEITTSQLVDAINNANQNLSLTIDDLEAPDFKDKTIKDGVNYLKIVAKSTSNKFKDDVIVTFSYDLAQLVIADPDITIKGINPVVDINVDSILIGVNNANPELKLTNDDVNIQLNADLKGAVLTANAKKYNNSSPINLTITFVDIRLDLVIKNHDLGAIKLKPSETEATVDQLVDAINAKNPGLNLKSSDLENKLNHKTIDEAGVNHLQIFANKTSKTFKGEAMVTFSYQLVNLEDIFTKTRLQKTFDLTSKDYFNDLVNELKATNPGFDPDELIFSDLLLAQNPSFESLLTGYLHYEIKPGSHKYKYKDNHLPNSLLITFKVKYNGINLTSLNAGLTMSTINSKSDDAILTAFIDANPNIYLDKNNLAVFNDDGSILIAEKPDLVDKIGKHIYFGAAKIFITIDNRSVLSINNKDVIIKGTNPAKDLNDQNLLKAINDSNKNLSLKDDDVKINWGGEKQWAILTVNPEYYKNLDPIIITVKFDDLRPKLVIANKKVVIEGKNYFDTVNTVSILNVVNVKNKLNLVRDVDVSILFDTTVSFEGNTSLAYLTVTDKYRNEASIVIIEVHFVLIK